MGTLKLSNSSGNFVALTPPSSIASDVTLTLPNTDGDANQYLQTDGAGALSWVTPTAGLTWNTLANDVSVGTGGAKTISGIDSSAKKVIMTWKNVSLNTNDAIYHYVASNDGSVDYGSYQTIGGYVGNSNSVELYTTSGTGGYFTFNGLTGNTYSFHGIAEYTYHGDNEWYVQSYLNYNLQFLGLSFGKVDLSAPLERIILGGLGSSVFDAGTVSVHELV